MYHTVMNISNNLHAESNARGSIPLGFFGDGARYVEHGDGKLYVILWNGLLADGNVCQLHIIHFLIEVESIV